MTSASRHSAGVLAGFGRLVYSARYLVLAIWAAGLLIALPFAPRVPRLLQPGGLSSPDLESQRASAMLQRQLGYNPATIVVVFTSSPDSSLTLDDPRWAA